MNRQQRRLMERQKAIEARHLQELREEQQMRQDASLDLYTICIALAHHDVYPDGDERIADFLTAWNGHVCRVVEGGKSYPEIQREAKEKTGIVYTITDRG